MGKKSETPRGSKPLSSPTYPFKFPGYERKGTAGLFSAFKPVAALEAENDMMSLACKRCPFVRYATYHHFEQGQKRRQRREGRQEQRSSLSILYIRNERRPLSVLYSFVGPSRRDVGLRCDCSMG
jgi:hypothetical protein